MKKILCLLMSVMLLAFCGCGASKYNVDYDGAKEMYQGARDSYRAGEEVELVFDLILTETNYGFYLDGEPVDWTYDETRGFVIRFVMPERDVKLTYTMDTSSMAPME